MEEEKLAVNNVNLKDEIGADEDPTEVARLSRAVPLPRSTTRTKKESELAKEVDTLYKNLTNQSIRIFNELVDLDDLRSEYVRTVEHIYSEVLPVAEIGDSELKKYSRSDLEDLIQIGRGIQDRLELMEKSIIERHPARSDGGPRLSRKERAKAVMQQLGAPAHAFAQQDDDIRGGDRSKRKTYGGKRDIRRCLKHGGRRSRRTVKRGGIFGKPSGYHRSKIAKALSINPDTLGVSDVQSEKHVRDDDDDQSLMGNMATWGRSLLMSSADTEALRPPPSGVEHGYDVDDYDKYNI